MATIIPVQYNPGLFSGELASNPINTKPALNWQTQINALGAAKPTPARNRAFAMFKRAGLDKVIKANQTTLASYEKKFTDISLQTGQLTNLRKATDSKFASNSTPAKATGGVSFLALVVSSVVAFFIIKLIP